MSQENPSSQTIFDSRDPLLSLSEHLKGIVEVLTLRGAGK